MPFDPEMNEGETKKMSNSGVMKKDYRLSERISISEDTVLEDANRFPSKETINSP